jgi:hypothetical protein
MHCIIQKQRRNERNDDDDDHDEQHGQAVEWAGLGQKTKSGEIAAMIISPKLHCAEQCESEEPTALCSIDIERRRHAQEPYM